MFGECANAANRDRAHAHSSPGLSLCVAKEQRETE